MIGPEVFMDIQEALKIMRALANGTNPENGEALEESSVCRRPQTVRALNRAISALVAEQGRETKRPRNAFAPGRVPKTHRFARSCARGWILRISPRRTIARYRRLWRGW